MTEQPLKIDLTDKEASSEARSFDAIPSGPYLVAVTEIELRESTSAKNPGKPYWNVELTIQDGEYADRKIWSNVMLWGGAAFTLVQLHRAAGFEVPDGGGTLEVRPADDFVGVQMVAIVKKMRDSYAEQPENGGDGKTPQWKNEVKGFRAVGDGPSPSAGGKPKAGAGSLLP